MEFFKRQVTFIWHFENWMNSLFEIEDEKYQKKLYFTSYKWQDAVADVTLFTANKKRNASRML